MTPSKEEIADTTTLHRCKESDLFVLSASMPYMPSGIKIRDTLFEHCLKKGFSIDFATSLVRLAINFLEGKRYSYGAVSSHDRSLQEFVNFLATHINNRSELTLTEINKQVWLDYLSQKEADHRPGAASKHFNLTRGVFNAYKPTALDGWLSMLSFRAKKSGKPSQEHTSELADTSNYSDVVMYQMLALFIEGFQRRIGYVKHYENLIQDDMPQDWFYPGRKKRYLLDPKVGDKKGHITETSALLSKWLNDEDEGYRIVIDHHIMYHKAGLVKDQTRTGFRARLKSASNTNLNPLVAKFHETMGRWHGYDYLRHSLHFLNFYVKKKIASEKNIVINQIPWCLTNLLMMQTGINKEVALTIPSRAENGESILTRGDSLFISSDGPTEVELFGIKAKRGNSPRKVIPIAIAKDSPLYNMLIDYERHVKVDFDGPFFEVNLGFSMLWSTAGGLANIEEVYPMVDENGEQLSSIESSRFRKVFASGQLLNRLQGIKDGKELAEKLRNDLHHGDLDVTITNYLMKSSVSRGVIDTAIATITSEKLEEGLRFKGKIALGESSNIKRKVFLCDCEDPTNPSHDVAIADECKHYDLCLGCERSVITKAHLPYICVRIIQYEDERRADPHIWPALFEDRWSIAHDAIERYVAIDKKHGQRLVDEAWAAANEGLVSLPPIIVSNRM